MSSRVLTWSLCAAGMALSPLAYGLDVSGNWEIKSASRYTVAFRQNGELVKGSYTFGRNYKGEIAGLMYDGVMEGYWFQDTANKKCAKAKNGTYYWGRVVLEFSGNDIQGKDNYCDAAPAEALSGRKAP